MNPVYRFNIGKKIFIFGMWNEKFNPSIEEFYMELNLHPFIRLHDGSHIEPKHISNVKKFDVQCPVNFLYLQNGQLVKW